MAEEGSPVVVDAPGATDPAEQVPDINMGAVSTYKIDPLKDDNWVAWRSRMTTMLKFQHAYDHVEGTVPRPDDPVKGYKWDQRDYLAQILIKNNTSDEQMVHINQDSVKTAAQMWSNLRAVHEHRGQSALTATKCTFYGIRAKDDANIPDHIAEMRWLQTRLSEKGYMVDNEEFKSVLIMSLLKIWDNFIASYQGTNVKPDKDGGHKVTSQELTSIIINEYQRRRDVADENRDQSYYAQSTSDRGKKRKVMVPDEKAPG